MFDSFAIHSVMISYDHKTPNKDYTAFFQAIQNNAQTWWHYLANTWLVKTELTETQFAQRLYPHMTTDDRLLIIKVDGVGDGWLPKDAWEWIGRQQRPDLPLEDFIRKIPPVTPPVAPPVSLKNLLGNAVSPSKTDLTPPANLFDLLKKRKQQ